MGTFPYSVSVLQALVPLAIEYLSVAPSVHSLTVSLATLKMTEVGVSIGVPLEAFAMTKVLVPCPLILAPISVLHDSVSASESCVSALSRAYQAYINGLLVWLLGVNHLEALEFCDLFDRLQVNLR